MWDLIEHLWNDEVGSSQSTEMALVTGVTIGALVISMRSFGNSVNSRFSEVEIRDDTMAQLQQKIEQDRRREELTQEEQLEQFRERRRVQLERRKQQSETLPAEDADSSPSD